MPRFNRLLLPTGFSELSRRASAWAVPIAEAFGSEVHVVHIVPHTELMLAVPAVEPGIGMAMPLPGPPAEELLANARSSLDRFVAEIFPSLTARVRTHASIGGVVDELVRYAEQNSIDVIVMGTHADGMLKRLVYGSVGKSVLEMAPCPVLLVPVRELPRK